MPQIQTSAPCARAHGRMRKKMRSKTRVIAGLASLLACAAMVGTGFASWVILSESTTEATGNVKAETVNDGSLKQFSADVSGGDIVYSGGTGSNQTTAGQWLINDQQAENLTATITLTIEGNLKELTASFSATTGWDEAVEKGYITAPVLSIASHDKVNVAEGGVGTKNDATPDTYGYKFTVTDGDFSSASTVEITATFGWGEVFNNQNPYAFFNDEGRKANDQLGEYYTTTKHDEIDALGLSISADTTWKAYATAVLNKLDELLTTSGANYTFVFNATPGQNA